MCFFLTFSEAFPLDRAPSLSNSINFEFILFVYKVHRTTSNIDFILMFLLTTASDVVIIRLFFVQSETI